MLRHESPSSHSRSCRSGSRSAGFFARASHNPHLHLDRQRVFQLLVCRGQLGGATAPLDEPPSDYVFAASGWNAAQTTIAIDGSNRYPDADTLTFNGNANVPLTLQIGSGNSLYLSPSSPGATTISVAQTGVTYTIAGIGTAYIQLSDDQQWSVDGDLEISAVIWDDGESGNPGFVKTGAGTLTLSGNNSFTGPISVAQGNSVLPQSPAWDNPAILAEAASRWPAAF